MSFDLLSSNWDTERRVKRAKIISDEIKQHIAITKEDIAMDFGCGTGLLSFHLHDDFRRIDLVDSSGGMIKKLTDKINGSSIKNMVPIHIDLTKNLRIDEKYNVIYTSMALHHISHIDSMIMEFYQYLAVDGMLCLVDLNTVSELFHKDEPDFTGHNGFDTQKIVHILEQNNFKNITTKIFYHSEKIIDDEVVPYSLFIIIATK